MTDDWKRFDNKLEIIAGWLGPREITLESIDCCDWPVYYYRRYYNERIVLLLLLLQASMLTPSFPLYY